MPKLSLAQHFKQYFRVVRADTDELKQMVYKIRYDVYAKELQYEKNCPKDCEKDQFDDYSHYALIQHLRTQAYAGCVRLVIPPQDNQQALLPFEQCCMDSVEPEEMNVITRHGKLFYGEISRLAVLASFRRRKGESANPYGINIDHSLAGVTEDEIRLFPFIAVALYLSASVIALENNLNHVIVMMEPRLSRLLARYGICFKQIGRVMEYHGKRAMFWCLAQRV